MIDLILFLLSVVAVLALWAVLDLVVIGFAATLLSRRRRHLQTAEPVVIDLEERRAQRRHTGYAEASNGPSFLAPV